MRYAVVASSGVWRSLVARFVRDEEAVGSNPATPTKKRQFRRLFSKAMRFAAAYRVRFFYQFHCHCWHLMVATPPCDVVLQNQASARQGEHREPDAASILGEPVHPERQFSALQVAIDLRALRNCEFAAEGAQERRLMPIDQVQ